jgi:hypothetical protein
MRTVGIIQPSYIPWRGFFDFIQEVDVFVFLDDVQYTLRDWRNRNRIKTRDGKTLWLSVPTLGGRNQLIKDVRIDNAQPWQRKHLALMQHNYGKAPCFRRYFGELQGIYAQAFETLAKLDIELVKRISAWLGIDTEFVVASALGAAGARDDRLLQLVRKLGGDVYLSGPAAKAYMRPEIWAAADIRLAYKDYAGYPEYPQICAPFEPAVTVLDLLFMVGPDAADYIWGKYRKRDGQ